MGEKIDLPSGAWIELRPVEEITERQLRPMKAKGMVMAPIYKKLSDAASASKLDQIDDDTIDSDVIAAAGLTADEAMLLMASTDDAAVALIAAWSFDGAVSLDALLDLPSRDYAAIQRLVTPLVSSMVPDFSVDGATDPKALTAN